MVLRKMRDPMDDIAQQARQGSVAAIIQTLNERLADAGVRTRAVFADGVLQLLCEAALPDQLEQSVTVAQIKQILEEISPNNIRRVKINSRIVREQQLLWLEEIMRDPDNQLLWCEEIVLAKPNFFKQLLDSRKTHHTTYRKKPTLPKASSRYLKEKNPYWRGIYSGVGLSILLMVVGWLLHERLVPKIKVGTPSPSFNATTNSSLTPGASPTPVSSPTPDPFVQAVRVAEQASVAGKTVQTSAQWLDLAAKWERASDLMKAVKPDDPRYKTARDRVNLYRQNSEAAQKQAAQRRS
jgi:DNA-binding TFAR19-related protein (PDSD5 family)